MISQTLYIALDILNCYKVYLQPPTKFFKAKRGKILFLNDNQCPIGNYYGLENMLPALKLKPGVCMKINITENKNEIKITITENNVTCKVELI